MIRRLVPYLLVPFCVLASVLATTPWLRSFPESFGLVPLVGAAVLSVLVPLVTVRLVRRLWLGTLVDVLVALVYTLAVVLREPFGFADLGSGVYHGPSQILTFALPLVSPRNLLVGPVLLTWVAGAVAGECFARRWPSVVPYVGFLASFGLAYAGSQRAAGSYTGSVPLRETLLAAGLLVALLLLRTAQAWVREDETAESTQAEGILPLRGLLVGVVTGLVVAAVAAVAVQADAFPKQASTPQRVPSIDQGNPLDPLSFIAGLRPRVTSRTAQPVFSVTTNRTSPGYFPIANVDFYDGSGWSFQRTFRPSGGVIPADTDPALRTSGPMLTQNYQIDDGPLSSTPWMPAVYRPAQVTGTAVDIDPVSGMIVPATALANGARYTVRSSVSATTFDHIAASRAQPDASDPGDTQVPTTLLTPLTQLVRTFTKETGVPSTPALPFLQALQKDLLGKYALSGPARGAATATPSPTTSAPTTAPATSPSSRTSTSPSSSHSPRDAGERPLAVPPSRRAQRSTSTSASRSPSSSASTTTPSSDTAGSTSFADVLGSILGADRSGTPEQFATLVALVARTLGVPARVATGFRVTDSSGADALPAGRYDVTSAEAWTWTEIPIVGRGWVVLDASPGIFAKQSAPKAAPAAPSPSSSDVPSRNALVTKSQGGHAVAHQSTVAQPSTSSGHGLVVALLIVIGVLLVLLLLVLASRKRLRAARRRRTSDPRTRLLGAWQESLDMLTESGLPELTALTSAEIAELTGEQFGDGPRHQATTLGTAANAVAYSQYTVVEPAQADSAWATSRELRKSVRGQLTIGARLTAMLSYHRPKLAGRPEGPTSWAASAAAQRPSPRRRRALPARHSNRRRKAGTRRR